MGFFAGAGEWLLDVLFPLGDTARIVRECSEDAVYALVSPLVLPSGVVALLPYRHRLVRALIIEAKFHHNQKAIHILGMVLAEYLESEREDEQAFVKTRYVLVPVPLGPRRQKERGYNQVEEVVRVSGLPYRGLLTRVRDTAAQTRLARNERLLNMSDAFTALPVENVAYIVLDDVTTTGATLRAASTALKSAGATHVEMLALAH